MNRRLKYILLSSIYMTVFTCSNPLNSNQTTPISSQYYSNELNIISVNPDSAIIDSSNVEFNIKISYLLASSDSGVISCCMMDADTFRASNSTFITDISKGSGEYNFNYSTKAIKMGNNMVIYVDICPIPHGSSWGIYASSTKSISFK